MESSEDNDEDSEKEKMDWGLCFALLKNRGFNHQEILNLSYPQFNAYMKNINNQSNEKPIYTHNVCIHDACLLS